MIRKLLLCLTLLFGSLGFFGGLAVTTATVSGANIYCTHGAGFFYPSKWAYGVNGGLFCGNSGDNLFNVTLYQACTQMATIYGWLNAPAPGNPNWNTDCNDNQSGTFPGFLESNATCYPGRQDYRTFISDSVNGGTELYTAENWVTC